MTTVYLRGLPYQSLHPEIFLPSVLQNESHLAPELGMMALFGGEGPHWLSEACPL
jgi:hypothetical protein